MTLEFFKTLLDRDNPNRVNAFAVLIAAIVLAISVLMLALVISITAILASLWPIVPILAKPVGLATELGILVSALAGIGGWTYHASKRYRLPNSNREESK